MLKPAKKVTYLPSVSDILFCDPSSCHGAALMEAAQFLDKSLCETWVFLQFRQLLRMLEQGNHAEIDHVHHRCIASHEQQESHLDRVFLAQVAWLNLLNYQL